MRVQSIGSFNGYAGNRSAVQNIKNSHETKIKQNISFRHADGEIIGGSVGAGVGVWGTLLALCSGPIGWLSIGAMALAGVGGAFVGGAGGNAITGGSTGSSSNCKSKE